MNSDLLDRHNNTSFQELNTFYYEQELHEFTFPFIKFSYKVHTMTIQTSIGLKDMNPELSTEGYLYHAAVHGTGCKLVA